MCAVLRNLCLPTLLLLLSSSCTLWRGGANDAKQWHVSLPADAAAAMLAAAIANNLRAEPIAAASGAPVSRQGSDFLIRLTSNGHGDWLPVASHRLVLRARRTTATVECIALRDEPLRGFGSHVQREVRLLIRSTDDGCSVSLWAPAADYEHLAPLVQRTLLFAGSLDGSGPGLAEPNLAAWRLTRLLAAAGSTIDATRRDHLLRRAALQPTAPSWLFQQLAEMAASNGQFADAANYITRGMLAEPDVLVRARLAKLAHGFALRTIEPPDLRARALHLLGSGDLENAEKLLHSARRSDPRPATDYRLLGELHRASGDKMAALAAELLAREYAADKTKPLQNTGLALDRKVSQRLRQLSIPPATPPR